MANYKKGTIIMKSKVAGKPSFILTPKPGKAPVFSKTARFATDGGPHKKIG